MHYVVDASVAVKWLLPEAHTSEAESLLSEDVTLSAPDLLYAEIGNVLWKRVISSDISHDSAQEALRQLLEVEIYITPGGLLLSDALDWRASTAAPSTTASISRLPCSTMPCS